MSYLFKYKRICSKSQSRLFRMTLLFCFSTRSQFYHINQHQYCDIDNRHVRIHMLRKSMRRITLLVPLYDALRRWPWTCAYPHDLVLHPTDYIDSLESIQVDLDSLLVENRTTIKDLDSYGTWNAKVPEARTTHTYLHDGPQDFPRSFDMDS